MSISQNGRRGLAMYHDTPSHKLKLVLNDQIGEFGDNPLSWPIKAMFTDVYMRNIMSQIAASCMIQVKAETSNYIQQIMWDVINCPFPWYLLLAQQSLYDIYKKNKHGCLMFDLWKCNYWSSFMWQWETYFHTKRKIYLAFEVYTTTL